MKNTKKTFVITKVLGGFSGRSQFINTKRPHNGYPCKFKLCDRFGKEIAYGYSKSREDMSPLMDYSLKDFAFSLWYREVGTRQYKLSFTHDDIIEVKKEV